VKIFRYDIPEKRIEMYGSSGALVLQFARPTKMGAVFIELEPGGVLGRHEAVGHQLFVVIAGSGEVSGGDGAVHRIEAGMAAFWEAGEEHETCTENGLKAIVIEGDDLEPGEKLEEVLSR